MTTKDYRERSALRIFLSYFKPHRGLFILDMICALMIALIDLAFPYISRWCMYELLPQSAYRTFFAAMGAVGIAFAVRAVLTYIIGYYGHTFGILVEADIRRDLFEHMQELDFGYYDRNRTGDRGHSAGVFRGGVDVPPLHERGVQAGEAENRRHQRGH